VVWAVLGLCGLGMRSCPMAFRWCGLGLTAIGWFGLFGAVGVVLCRVYVTAFGGYRGGVVPS
jgi:hypothetical protein